MALRVLLADESPTIKKVIQLALQDFSVEVKAVPVGTDVLSIAKLFNPDIIFVDVLLAKKNGYDVCKELKTDQTLKQFPVVLMWNSLMGIDEVKAKSSLADKRLEKPFEVETLRSLIQELTPKTATNPISSYLKFGDIDALKSNNKNSSLSQSPPAIPPKFSTIPSHDLPNDAEEIILPEELQIVDSEDEFAQVPLHKPSEDLSLESENDLELESPENWQSQPISSLNNLEKDPNEVVLADLKNATRRVTESFEEIIFDENALSEDLNGNHNNHNEHFSPSIPVPQLSNLPLDAKTQERIFREEVRVIAEKICWTLLPDITERVVREEIKKLLQEP